MSDATGKASSDDAQGVIPAYVDALHQSLACLEADDMYGAINIVEDVLESNPDLSVAIHVLGLASFKMDELGRARELFDTAHKLDPNCLETADALAILSARIGNLSESTYYGKLVTALEPHPYIEGLLPDWYGTFAEAFLAVSESRYGKVADRMVRAGDIGGAVDMFRKEAEAHPSDPDAQRNFAGALLIDERPYEALVIFQKLGRFSTLTALDEAMVSNCLSRIGRASEAARVANGIISEGALSAETASLLVGDIVNDPNASPAEQVAAEIGLAQAFGQGTASDRDVEPLGTGVFKIGFVTGRAHSRGGLECFWPLITALAARRAAVHVYSVQSVEDPIGRRLRGTVANWVDAGEVDDDTLSEIIRNDGIHVLIDLDRHSGTGRPLLFLRKPAPVAMRLMGLPDSAEAQGFDMVLGDQWIYPGSDEDERICAVDGGLFRLPGASFSGQETGEEDLLQPDVDAEFEGVSFGLTAARNEVTDGVWEQLKRISDAVPSCRFVFAGRRVGGDFGSGELLEKADEFGLSGMIRFTEDSPSMTARDFVDSSDIVLQLGGSGWPAAIAEAVSLARPIVVCPGLFPEMRLGTSVLGGLNQNDVIVDSLTEAADMAVSLATDETARTAVCEALINASAELSYEEASNNWAEAFLTATVVAYRRKTRA